jgi:hypothetical protein
LFCPILNKDCSWKNEEFWQEAMSYVHNRFRI